MHIRRIRCERRTVEVVCNVNTLASYWHFALSSHMCIYISLRSCVLVWEWFCSSFSHTTRNHFAVLCCVAYIILFMLHSLSAFALSFPLREWEDLGGVPPASSLLLQLKYCQPHVVFPIPQHGSFLCHLSFPSCSMPCRSY